jgi:hypothetical protein
MPNDSARTTAFATAMTSGMLLALAAHILSGWFGIGMASLWQETMQTDATAMRSALGWWTITAAGLAGGFFVVPLTHYLSGEQRLRQRLRWLVGVLFFLLLAIAPHLAATAPVSSLRVALGANLAVFALATLTAFCGSWFATR